MSKGNKSTYKIVLPIRISQTRYTNIHNIDSPDRAETHSKYGYDSKGLVNLDANIVDTKECVELESINTKTS